MTKSDTIPETHRVPSGLHAIVRPCYSFSSFYLLVIVIIIFPHTWYVSVKIYEKPFDDKLSYSKRHFIFTARFQTTLTMAT